MSALGSNQDRSGIFTSAQCVESAEPAVEWPALITLPDRALVTAEDLRGCRLGVPGPGAAFDPDCDRVRKELRAMLRRAGIDDRGVEFVNIRIRARPGSASVLRDFETLLGALLWDVVDVIVADSASAICLAESAGAVRLRLAARAA